MWPGLVEPRGDFRIVVYLLSYCFLLFENETQITMYSLLVLIGILKLLFCLQIGCILCQTAIKFVETIRTNEKVARVVVSWNKTLKKWTTSCLQNYCCKENISSCLSIKDKSFWTGLILAWVNSLGVPHALLFGDLDWHEYKNADRCWHCLWAELQLISS